MIPFCVGVGLLLLPHFGVAVIADATQSALLADGASSVSRGLQRHAESSASAGTCNQLNKQKALYGQFDFEPSLSASPATDVVVEVIWGDPTSLRTHGNNGIYDAFMTYFLPGMKGYFGVQIKGGASNKDMLLFSVWDKDPGETAWAAALPRHPNCARNCNDCAVHKGPKKAPDSSTGTKCFVEIPDGVEGTTFQLRIRRVGVDVKASMYDKEWIGDEYEVTAVDKETGKSWIVGRQLLANQNQGIQRMSTFHEHIGCTTCRAFHFKQVSLASLARLLSSRVGGEHWLAHRSLPCLPRVFAVGFNARLDNARGVRAPQVRAPRALGS